MNTYALLVFIIIFNLSVGSLTSFQSSNGNAANEIYANSVDLNNINNENLQAYSDTYSASNDQNADKRAGNENKYTTNLIKSLKGIGDFIQLRARNQIEGIILGIIKMFYASVNLVCGLVIFDKIKNRKVD